MLLKQLLILDFSSILVACASSDEAFDDEEMSAGTHRSDCISSGTIRDYIAAIRQLTPEEHEELLVRFGKIEPEIEQTPAPVRVDSAEVEELD
ncbi:MAG: hypothetical protein ACR2QX_09695 [Woeseiaceae bacterium]